MKKKGLFVMNRAFSIDLSMYWHLNQFLFLKAQKCYFYLKSDQKKLMKRGAADSLQARIEKKLDEELPQEWMGGIKLGPKVSGNQGLSKS